MDVVGVLFWFDVLNIKTLNFGAVSFGKLPLNIPPTSRNYTMTGTTLDEQFGMQIM